MEPRDPDGPPEETYNCRCTKEEYTLSDLPKDLLAQIEHRLNEEQKLLLQGVRVADAEEGEENISEEEGPPTLNIEADRKKSIINDTPAIFEVAENPNADDSPAFHEWHNQNEVAENEEFIVKEADAQGIDPDLVRAIIYMETTRGWYDKFLLGLNNSVRPMNVGAVEWADLGVTREDLDDPETNIRIGITILKRISERVKDPTIAKIASVYNFLGRENVNDYGARVAKIYDLKLWEKPKDDARLQRIP